MNTTQNPFPGLRSFDYEESHLFFGRETSISDLLRKLRSNRFVAIVGTSGSGKSSLVRAGLLPAIRHGTLGGDGGRWLITAMKPGNTPVAHLTRALLANTAFGTGDAGSDRERAQHVDTLLRASRLGLVQAVREMLAPKTSLLLLLDQFEETFRFSGEGMEHNDEESTQFVNLVIDAVRQHDVPIYVVLTIRSDFLGDCARFEGLPEAINDGHYLVPRLTQEQNRAAITGPILYAQGKISPRLIHRVIQDLGDNPDQLPVLQHALMQTWDVWKATGEPGEPMDIRHYEMTGGMEHALSNHADEAYHELPDEARKRLVETIFTCLAVKTGENRGVRRPTSMRALMEITGASFDGILEVLHPFRRAGRTFVLPADGHPVTEQTVMDISHESLMRAWERMRQWVDAEAESAALYQRLCESALLHREGKAALWRNPELQMALEWKEKTAPNEAWARQYHPEFRAAMGFLEASRMEDEAERARMNRRTRTIRASIAAFMVVITVLSVWALLQTREATIQTAHAERNRQTAVKTAQEAILQKQLAERAKEMALQASKSALDAKTYAELQSNIAREQKLLAEEQRAKAEQEAVRATQQQMLALSEKLKADSSQAEADRLRMLSVSQNIAFKSLQEKGKGELPALLAYQAYRFAEKNRGNMNDAQLYSALYTSAQLMDEPYDPVVSRGSEPALALAVSEGVVLTLTSGGAVHAIDPRKRERLQRAGVSGLPSAGSSAWFSGDAMRAAIGLDNNEVAVFEPGQSGRPRILSGHAGLVRAAAFSRDGSIVVTGARDSTVRIWREDAPTRTVKCGSRIRAVAFSADQSAIYAGGEDGTTVRMRADGSGMRTVASGTGRVQSISISRGMVSIGYSNGMIHVIDTEGRILRTMTEPAGVDVLAFNAAGDVLTAGLANRTIRIYLLSETDKAIDIRCNSVITALTTDGEFVYAACADWTIRSYPVRTSYFAALLSQRLTRRLNRDEWNTYIGTEVTYEH